MGAFRIIDYEDYDISAINLKFTPDSSCKCAILQSYTYSKVPTSSENYSSNSVDNKNDLQTTLSDLEQELRNIVENKQVIVIDITRFDSYFSQERADKKSNASQINSDFKRNIYDPHQERNKNSDNTNFVSDDTSLFEDTGFIAAACVPLLKGSHLRRLVVSVKFFRRFTGACRKILIDEACLSLKLSNKLNLWGGDWRPADIISTSVLTGKICRPNVPNKDTSTLSLDKLSKPKSKPDDFGLPLTRSERKRRRPDLRLVLKDMDGVFKKLKTVERTPSTSTPSTSEANPINNYLHVFQTTNVSFFRCYMCKKKKRSTVTDGTRQQMCDGCDSLNRLKRHQRVNLQGRTALVTGGRIKIGFEVVLKLLRDGCYVIATTRFPKDAARRFAALADYEEWRDRLDIYKLDLMSIQAIYDFSRFYKQTYKKLDILINNAAQTIRRPHAFYRDLVLAEETSLEDREAQLVRSIDPSSETCHNSASLQTSCIETVENSVKCNNPNVFKTSHFSDDFYKTSQPITVNSSKRSDVQSEGAGWSLISAEEAAVFPPGKLDADGQQVDMRTSNTWWQGIEEVQAEELAEVLAVNTVAPYVLTRELKCCLMYDSNEQKVPPDGATEQSPTNTEENCPNNNFPTRTPEQNDNSKGSENRTNAKQMLSEEEKDCKPTCTPGQDSNSKRHRQVLNEDTKNPLLAPLEKRRFIVNVSAMEGQFSRVSKNERHPHTNMAKAALNMLTRTCAVGYVTDHIYVTSVDTGWVTDERPHHVARRMRDQGWRVPLDCVDGAARVYDPIVSGLQTGPDAQAPHYAVFLKNFKPHPW